MKQPLIRARSTQWREWRDSILAFAVIGVMFFIADHWHFVETKWRAVSVIVEVAISAIALCVFGLVVRTASSLFWPVMYALVAWHRERAAKRDATMVPKEYVPATFSSNLRGELFMAARLLLWGVLGFGILWGIRACSKAIIEPALGIPFSSTTSPTTVPLAVLKDNSRSPEESP